ncbi:flippase [Thermosulfurimonas sp. F29]|nr:flippase [Thermosulfurimonas sp. F29]
MVREFLQNKDKKQLFENFISLSLLQGVNYILPLITLPYLVRVLGPEKFGLIAFSRAFVQYFNVLTDYGFNLSATREISIYRESKERISEIFSAVMIIKLILLIFSLVILTIIVFSFQKFLRDWEIYYLSFGMVVGQVLFPVWFFQGMERMKYITFLNLMARLLFTISIFIFIRKVSDYIYVPLLNSVGIISAGLLGIWVAFKKFPIYLKIPSWTEVKHQLKEGGYIFISRISISFYTISNVFFLGLLTNNTIVGIYSAAERLINAIKAFNNVILQVMFPFISKVAKESPSKTLKIVNEELKIFLTLELALCVFIYLFSYKIVLIFLGKNFIDSAPIIRILIFTVPLILASAVIGQQILLNFNLKRLFTTSIVYVSLFHLVLLPIFIHFMEGIGAAIVVLITECAIVLFRIVGLYKADRKLFALLRRAY